MFEMNLDELARHKRVKFMLQTDIRTAEKNLGEHGFTPTQILAPVEVISPYGVWLQFHPGAPKELRAGLQLSVKTAGTE